jgi:hypothetical protein
MTQVSILSRIGATWDGCLQEEMTRTDDAKGMAI